MNQDREYTIKILDGALRMANAISFQLQREIKNSRMNSIELVVSMLHKRIHANLISIRILVADERLNNPISGSILFRAIALDYMKLLYLKIQKEKFEGKAYRWMGEISSEFQKEIDILLIDQLKRFYKDYYELIGVQLKNEAEYEEFVEGFKNNLPPEYRHIDKNTSEYNFKSPSKLYRYLKEHLPSDEFNTNLKTIWDFYSAYSKIDHFGIVSIVNERIPFVTFIRQLRMATLYMLDAFSIIGVDFMQVEAFAKMWIDINQELNALEQPKLTNVEQ